MKRIKEVVFTLIIPFFILSFCLLACRQKPGIYDQNVLTKSTELHLGISEKRGIITSSGIVYLVDKDMKTLTAYQKDKILWKANIIERYGQPLNGKNEIEFIRLEQNYISVSFSKRCKANVDIITGKIKLLGCD
jgi:hypothetical protein